MLTTFFLATGPLNILSIHDHIALPPEFPLVNPSINTMESLPVLLGLRRWALGKCGTTIEIVTDNSQVMYMVNAGRSHNKRCMGWLIEIFWTCFVY